MYEWRPRAIPKIPELGLKLAVLLSPTRFSATAIVFDVPSVQLWMR